MNISTRKYYNYYKKKGEFDKTYILTAKATAFNH